MALEFGIVEILAGKKIFLPVMDMEIPSADVAHDEVLAEYLGRLGLPDGGGAVGVGVAHPDEGGRGAVDPLAVDVEAAPGVGVAEVGVGLEGPLEEGPLDADAEQHLAQRRRHLGRRQPELDRREVTACARRVVDQLDLEIYQENI